MRRYGLIDERLQRVDSAGDLIEQAAGHNIGGGFGAAPGGRGPRRLRTQGIAQIGEEIEILKKLVGVEVIEAAKLEIEVALVHRDSDAHLQLLHRVVERIAIHQHRLAPGERRLDSATGAAAEIAEHQHSKRIVQCGPRSTNRHDVYPPWVL